MLHVLECGKRMIDRIGHALDGDAAGPSRHARVRGRRHQARAGLACDAAGKGEPLLAECLAAQKDHRRLAALQDARGGVDRRIRDRPCRRHGRERRHAVPLVPSGIRGEDQGGDLAGRSACRRDRGSTVRGDAPRIGRGAHPTRDRPCQSLDVGSQGRVIGAVIGRVLADDVDERC